MKEKIQENKSIIVLAVLMLVLIIGSVVCMSGGGDETTTSNGGTFYDLTADANATEGGIEYKTQEEIEAELNAKVADGMINVSMNTNPVFENGTGNLLITNSDVNNYPQIIEIYDENNQLIYQSGLIEVGSKVETGLLLVGLSVGDHDCMATFNAVNPTTGELAGRANVNIVVTVK